MQKDPWGHARQLAEMALITLPNVPAGQLQLVKALLPRGETDGGGHTKATDEPAPQKLLTGHSTLELLDVHRLPAGQVVDTELPAAQNIPIGQVLILVEPATHTVPAGHRSWTVVFGQKLPEAQRTCCVEFCGQNEPSAQVEIVAGELQTLPAGHGFMVVEPDGQ